MSVKTPQNPTTPVTNFSFTMARMHTPGKGISGSAIPYSRRAPGWLKTTSEEAKELISKLAKKGLTPSQVGIVLRDSHGIGLIKNLTGSKIVRILKAQGKNFTIKSPSQGLICTLCARIILIFLGPGTGS